ncbi:MAG: thiamine pyrophosphate-binding protein [Burkholderiales bacterium]|nr:thiamine pyrophosphate-binding protein [Burkholderiales bacterium]
MSKVTVARYIAETLAARGLTHVFMITGGGAMFLNDAFGHQTGITPVFCHHEQACAIAAEGYARIAGRPGVVNVTTGPGGLNALNGVFGAWTDSVPMLVISGQVKRETALAATPVPGLRQLGDQEANIVPVVRTFTKYAVSVLDPLEIGYHLERALHLVACGRPGPCWLDIPVDVQSAQVDPTALRGYHPGEDPPSWRAGDVDEHCRFILEALSSAKRPVVMAGSGVRAAGALEQFEAVIRRLGVPVTTAWTHDTIASDDPLFCGRPGTIGTRAGNFTVQNADVLLVLGSRLNIRQVSYNWQSFARHAFVIQVDVDAAELDKPLVRPAHAIHCDLKALLSALAIRLAAGTFDAARHTRWLEWCKERVAAYPPVLARQRVCSGPINPYHFVEELFRRLDATDIVACGNATACIVPFQAAALRRGQRMFSNSGSASMGHDLPAAIGAYFGAFASRGAQQRVICLAGDGSIMLNIQELQTIAHGRLPLKIFVLNNRGYLSIRSTQQNFFGRLTGSGPESGVSFPDFGALGRAFGLPARSVSGPDFPSVLDEVLAAPGPCLCDIVLDPAQGFEPRMSSRQLADGRIVSAPLEDMYPFLDRDELARNMLVS